MQVDALSPREVEVLEQLSAGARVKLIAKRLFISETTVRFHLRNIFSKLGVHSQAELVEQLSSIPDLGPRSAQSSGDPADAVVDEFDRVNARVTKAVRAAWGDESRSLKNILRAILPLDAERRLDWTTFFKMWALDTSEGDLHEARERGHALIVALALETFRNYQTNGVIREDVDAEEAVDTLYGLTITAASQILFKDTPGTRAEQLGMIDAYIDSITCHPDRD